MKPATAERAIDSGHGIFPKLEQRAPGRVFFRPKVMTFLEPRDLLPDPDIFRIGFRRSFPGGDGPGIVLFGGRIISSVLVELQRRLRNGVPPIIQTLAYRG